jgi:hypothetical protein
LANRKTPLRLDEGRIKKNEREEKKKRQALSVKINNDIASNFFFLLLPLSLSLFLFRPRDVKSA